ncbi:MAG: histidinol dehydrogenase [Planctomycetaceae bacterium]|jgi:histidinol dehydrogenase|nr:histidinol dehydrogenase [Planctomycetaceae bacterium]
MTQPLAIQWIDARERNVDRKMTELRRKLSPRGDIVSEAGRRRTLEIFGKSLTPQQIVEMICRDVDERGLSALLDYNKRIDRAEITPETLRVGETELVAAHRQAEPAFLQTLRNIRDNIRTFQSAILHKDSRIERPGGYLAERYRPMRRVGICVPGGAAAYPSTVLMTAVPAQAAGVKELAVIAPPTKFGSNNPDLLATCWELGITEVYRMGGAQGVAALAYGIAIHKGEPNEETIVPKVDKIVGPGNLFVALAKKFVFGEVDIDSIAGPSEVVVIVDSTTEPDYTAFDMLAQAEHSPGASILIGWDKTALEKTVAAIEKQLSRMERGELARQSLEDFGAVIVVRDAEEACAVTDAIAPEHLHIATQNAEELADRISYAGAMFLGNHTPVAVGDYAAGPSHVLPTSGTARFASGLTCNDFLRANSILHFDRSGLAVMADDVRRLATKEGLAAHRESVEVRLKEIK